MKKEVLLELAEKWERDAIEPKCSDGSKEAERQNAIDQGIRNGKRQCADSLRALIDILI